MSERAVPVRDEERERQRKTLGALFEAAGLKLTPAAAAIGVSASQLSRYLSGQTILPTPTYPAVARAFGISRDDLAVRLLGLAAPASPPAESDDGDWDFRAELAQAAAHPRQVDALYRDYCGLSIAMQRVIVDTLAVANEIDLPPRSRERAIAEERADYPVEQTGT